MLTALTPRSAGTIGELMQRFQGDPRPVKIDLGVGLYRTEQGTTPVMRAVKAAEKQLWQTEDSKSYVALAGGQAFTDEMTGVLLGNSVPRDGISAVATPGGTGAVRQAFELILLANPKARIFVSDPTWPNHLSMLDYLRIETIPYRYLDAKTNGVDFAGMMADLAMVKPGDVVLLHGCCHNPTGANLNLTEWQAVIDLLNRTGAVPMIDIAYQGFGDGLEADAAGTRLVASSCPETLIASSCSKNFSIYRERTGILLVVAQEAGLSTLTQGNLAYLNRQNYSFPPDHGARLVAMILSDAALRANWLAELEEMRLGMLGLRQGLAQELQRLSGSDRFGFLTQHRGMFSQLGISPEQVERLRAEHAIYMLGDSRMNIAGLNSETIPIVAKAIIEAGG
ncbi:Aspartate aminotransferase [hydrothermal vent metagenome]|uniref:Aspartate aminotransferase n=1 Tax=hydrothermal vent metagenome TaxID=652676 RepID=A0A3B0SPG9_9ZZZZ